MGLGFSRGSRLLLVYYLGGDGVVPLVENAACTQLGLGGDWGGILVLYRNLHRALALLVQISIQGYRVGRGRLVLRKRGNWVQPSLPVE